MARGPKLITGKDLNKRMRGLSEWTINKKETQLSKSFTVPSFIAGLALIAKVTVYAEILQHHPDVELSYDKVKIKLTTHDVKGLTKTDFELAKKIDNIRLKI